MDDILQEEAKQVFNEGFIGMTEYVMPIVLVLSIMAIFGLRIILFNGTRINKYMLYSAVITSIFVIVGIVLTNLNPKISEPIISAITTITTVLFIIQVAIQTKLRKK